MADEAAEFIEAAGLAPVILQYQLPFLDAAMKGQTLRLEHTRKGPVWRAVPTCTCGVGEQYEDDHDDDCAIWRSERDT